MIAGVLGERTLEQEHVQNLQEVPESALRPPSASVSCENSAAFQQSRRLFGQFGQLLWEKRSKIHLLKKVNILPITYIRDLKFDNEFQNWYTLPMNTVPAPLNGAACIQKSFFETLDYHIKNA